MQGMLLNLHALLNMCFAVRKACKFKKDTGREALCLSLSKSTLTLHRIYDQTVFISSIPLKCNLLWKIQ